MQAVVCRNDIGWREKARRLLVFSTDAGFHYAGDGKVIFNFFHSILFVICTTQYDHVFFQLGGIVRPNDGMCHLDNKGWYTYSSYQDYPSISHVNLKVRYEYSISAFYFIFECSICFFLTGERKFHQCHIRCYRGTNHSL